jgi:hypothetical protein
MLSRTLATGPPRSSTASLVRSTTHGALGIVRIASKSTRLTVSRIFSNSRPTRPPAARSRSGTRSSTLPNTCSIPGFPTGRALTSNWISCTTLSLVRRNSLPCCSNPIGASTSHGSPIAARCHCANSPSNYIEYTYNPMPCRLANAGGRITAARKPAVERALGRTPSRASEFDFETDKVTVRLPDGPVKDAQLPTVATHRHRACGRHPAPPVRGCPTRHARLPIPVACPNSLRTSHRRS